MVYDSKIANSRVEFYQNYVNDNKIIGPNAALFHVTGGIFNATLNTFDKNGYISDQDLFNNPATNNREYPENYVPWYPYYF